MTSMVIETYKKLREKMAIDKNKTDCLVKSDKSNEIFLMSKNETEGIDTI